MSTLCDGGDRRGGDRVGTDGSIVNRGLGTGRREYSFAQVSARNRARNQGTGLVA